MERIIRPVSRQLLRSHPRYPFSIPPPIYTKRLYSMGHTVPSVSWLEVAETVGLHNELTAGLYA